MRLNAFKHLPFVTACVSDRVEFEKFFIKEDGENYPLFLLKSYIRNINDTRSDSHDIAFLFDELPQHDIVHVGEVQIMSKMMLRNVIKAGKGSKEYELNSFFDKNTTYHFIKRTEDFFSIVQYDSGLMTLRLKAIGQIIHFGMMSFDCNFKSYMQMFVHYPEMVDVEFYENQIFKYQYLSEDSISARLDYYSLAPNIILKILSEYREMISAFVKYFESFGVECEEVYNFDHFLAPPIVDAKSFEDIDNFNSLFRENLLSLYSKYLCEGSIEEPQRTYSLTNRVRGEFDVEYDTISLQTHEIRRDVIQRRRVFKLVADGVKL